MDVGEIVEKAKLALKELEEHDFSKLINDPKNKFDTVVRQIINNLDDQIKNYDIETQDYIKKSPETYRKLIRCEDVTPFVIWDPYKKYGLPDRTRELEDNANFLSELSEVEGSYYLFRNKNLISFVDGKIKRPSLLIRILKKIYLTRGDNFVSRFVDNYYNREIQNKYSELKELYCGDRENKSVGSTQLATILTLLSEKLYEKEKKIRELTKKDEKDNINKILEKINVDREKKKEIYERK